MALIAYVTEYWTEFDGWCLEHGIAPLEIPSRRFFSAAWRWMTDGLDDEAIQKIHAQMDQAVYDTEAAHRIKARTNASQESESESDGKKFIPLGPFQAPPGWKPPGWSDEAAYKNSLAGMMGVTSTGGGKIGGTVR